MSYILEALKKIEQKQQREGIPRLLTIPTDVSEEPRKKSVLPYVIVGALVLNAVIMMTWWMAPWRGMHRPIESSPAEVQQKDQARESQPLAALEDAVRSNRSAEQIAPKLSDRSVLLSSRPLDKAPDAKPIQSVKVNPPAVPPSDIQTKETKSPPAARSGRLLTLEELPAAVKGGLPEFRISGHAYSPEPRLRVARVNNKIVQEGEALSQGLRVDEIVPGGVIFTYQGYRFKIAINDN